MALAGVTAPAASRLGLRSGFRLALRLAVRELRGGLSGFYIFVVCLFLGVVTIASVGTLSSSLVAGLTQRGQEILGGDMDLRLIHREAGADEAAYLRNHGDVSHVATLRAMVSTLPNDHPAKLGTPTSKQILVEAKAVDGLYPLIGQLALKSGADLSAALGPQPARVAEARAPLDTGAPVEKAAPRAPDIKQTAGKRPFFAVAEESLLVQLGIGLGDAVTFGQIELIIANVITQEPDRLAGGFALGPRLMMSTQALRASGLWQAGSLINHHYRLRLHDSSDSRAIDRLRQALEEEFPLAGWRVRDRRDASPAVRRSIERVALFLTLVGLTALTVGGVGVGNAITAFLDQRRAAIATFKALGAPRHVITGVFIIHIGLIAMVAIAAALALAAFAPVFLADFVGQMINLPMANAAAGLNGLTALGSAALFGVVTAFGFMFVPLGKALQTPVSVLFRGATETLPQSSAPLSFRLLAGSCLLIVVALSFVMGDRRDIAAWFVVTLALSFGLLRLSAWAVQALARRLASRGGFHRRLAMRNIIAPGAPVSSITLSVGLSVILVTVLAMVQGNFERQLVADFPDRAPSFFALDIQPDQIQAFRQFSTEFDGFESMQTVPMLRGAVLAVNDVPVKDITPPAEIAWFLRGDRGLTYADRLPAGARLTAGQWWPSDYEGPPLISLDQRIASGLGLGIGDRLSVNILGRPLTGEIANLRDIDWGSGQLNFAVVFSPSPLKSAPHTYLATITMRAENEVAFTQALTRNYRNVSLVRVKEAVQSVRNLLDQFSLAIGALSLTAIATSIFVLAGALASSRQGRLYEAAILGSLGASRRTILGVFMIEYGFIGCGAAILGAVIGTASSWAVISLGLRSDWQFLPDIFMISIGGALGLSLLLALIALRQQMRVPWRRILLAD